jgi:hypothetical protein
MYQTIEARLENNKVIFENDFNIPKNNAKVLITFIEFEENENENEKDVTPIYGSEEVL